VDDRVRKSRKQERKGMERRGGRTTKNDGRTNDSVVEFKRTDGKTITLQGSDLRDAEFHALDEGREFELPFELMNRRYVVVTESYLDELRRGQDANQDLVRRAQPRVASRRKVSGGRDKVARSVLSRPEQFRNRHGEGGL
jgi:hypothetical protein